MILNIITLNQVESQKEGQLSFLKANTGAVMDQLDRLVLLKNMFEEDQRKNGKEPLPSLQAAIEGTLDEIQVSNNNNKSNLNCPKITVR